MAKPFVRTLAILTMAIVGFATLPQAEAAVISTATPGLQSTDWIKWDAKTCSIVPAKAPSTGPWKAVLQTTTGIRIGYATQSEGVAVVDLANASMKSATEAIGGQYIFGNYSYPDAAKALDAANSIVTRHADVVISWNLLAPAMSTLLAVYKKACIPVIQVSAKADGAAFFGPDNNEVGTKEGAGLATWAHRRGWQASQLTILAITVPSLGASINLRSSGCVAAIQKVFPAAETVAALPLSLSATAEAQTKFRDWLTANPGRKKILVCTPSDTSAVGISNAASGVHRMSGVGVGGVGGSPNPGRSFVGTVDSGYKTYGKFLIPLAVDLKAGKPVPASLAPVLTFVGRIS